MNPEAMRPYGLCLLDYFEGNKSAAMSIIRDDGFVASLPASGFFRDPREFEIEKAALDLASGRVLDAGAGTGIHSKYLQDQGLSVCAVDLLPETVHIMRKRGVLDVRQADITSFKGEKFDTVIMMGHGIGVVEDLSGLSRFLDSAKGLLAPEGQILLTSVDVRCSKEPKDISYQEKISRAGRYFGEIRMQIKYGDIVGSLCGWLQVDIQTLTGHARQFGWDCREIFQQDDGNYLARLCLLKEPS